MAHLPTVLSGRSSRVRALVGAALLGAAFVVAFAASGTGATANASDGLYYQHGYYVVNSWLCYGWSNGSYHCTQHWHRSGGQLISDNPAWVPNNVSTSNSTSSSSSSAATRPASVTGSNTAGQPCHSSTMFPAHISQWTTPVSCYAGIYRVNPANYVYRSGYGWCNWWPEVLHPRQPDIIWGGQYRHSSVPTPGAVVRFSPGVQGASSDGHYAQVVAVAPDHYWVLVTEMNFTWRGGGWQKVSYRYIHVGSGVTFIS